MTTQELMRPFARRISIFMREAQLVWPELQPFVDDRATSAAKKLGLPGKAEELQKLVGGDAAKFVRCALLIGFDDTPSSVGQRFMGDVGSYKMPRSWASLARLRSSRCLSAVMLPSWPGVHEFPCMEASCQLQGLDCIKAQQPPRSWVCLARQMSFRCFSVEILPSWPDVDF